MDERGAGWDGHQKAVVARVVTPAGPAPRPLGTMTAALRSLAAWLLAYGGTPVAIGRPGDARTPVVPLLAGTCEVWRVKAQHLQAGPGRQPEVQAAARRAELLPPGLWRASGIPPVAQRARRDLPRSRGTGLQERVTRVNRVQQRLDAAHLKLAAGASDSRGGAGRARLAARLTGPPDPQARADVAKGRLRRTRDRLAQA